MANAYQPIRIYTGVMGEGKTLKAVDDLLKEIAYDQTLPVEQRNSFYSDITGLKIENVKQSPDDWRDLPPNSLCVYDEADENDHFKAGTNKVLSDMLFEMKYLRKRKVRLWFIVQHPSQLNVFIRRQAHLHIHLRRPLGMELAKVYYFKGVCSDPNDMALS